MASDFIVGFPGETRRGFRGHACAGARRDLRPGLFLQILAPPRHARCDRRGAGAGAGQDRTASRHCRRCWPNSRPRFNQPIHGPAPCRSCSTVPAASRANWPAVHPGSMRCMRTRQTDWLNQIVDITVANAGPRGLSVRHARGRLSAATSSPGADLRRQPAGPATLRRIRPAPLRCIGGELAFSIRSRGNTVETRRAGRRCATGRRGAATRSTRCWKQGQTRRYRHRARRAEIRSAASDARLDCRVDVTIATPQAHGAAPHAGAGRLHPQDPGAQADLRPGPRRHGKTYLAVAAAVAAMAAGEVERLVLSRPAVEAGERIGFLPGDMKEKVDPYLRPLYDALGDMLPARPGAAPD